MLCASCCCATAQLWFTLWYTLSRTAPPARHVIRMPGACAKRKRVVHCPAQVPRQASGGSPDLAGDEEAKRTTSVHKKEQQVDLWPVPGKTARRLWARPAETSQCPERVQSVKNFSATHMKDRVQELALMIRLCRGSVLSGARSGGFVRVSWVAHGVRQATNNGRVADVR